MIHLSLCLSAQSIFGWLSTLRIYKHRTGWNLDGAMLPFNALCVFTFSLKLNEMVSMKAMEIDGAINNVDIARKLMWVTCPLEVQATEWRRKDDPVDKCADISNLHFGDNRVHRTKRHASYLVHEQGQMDLDQMSVAVGDFVRCGLKLSTKTNRKLGSEYRAVFVQAWNLRTGQRAQVAHVSERKMDGNYGMDRLGVMMDDDFGYISDPGPRSHSKMTRTHDAASRSTKREHW